MASISTSSGFGRKDVLHDVDIFSFDKDGNLTRYLHGDRADIEPNGSWLLTGVVQKQVEAAIFHTEDLPSLVWQPFITLSQLQLLRLPIDTMPPVELDKYLRHLKRQALPAGQYEQELWARIAFPLSIVAMIMVAAPLVFGKVRARNGYQIVVGAAIGHRVFFERTDHAPHRRFARSEPGGDGVDPADAAGDAGDLSVFAGTV